MALDLLLKRRQLNLARMMVPVLEIADTVLDNLIQCILNPVEANHRRKAGAVR